MTQKNAVFWLKSAILSVQKDSSKVVEVFKESKNTFCEFFNGAKALSKMSLEGPFGQVRQPAARIFAFVFFGLLKRRKTRFAQKWGTCPRSFFLLLQNLDSIFKLAPETSCHTIF